MSIQGGNPPALGIQAVIHNAVIAVAAAPGAGIIRIDNSAAFRRVDLLAINRDRPVGNIDAAVNRTPAGAEAGGNVPHGGHRPEHGAAAVLAVVVALGIDNFLDLFIDIVQQLLIL